MSSPRLLAISGSLLRARLGSNSAAVYRRGFAASQCARQVIHDADESTFKSHIANTKDKIILVDFYEDWCGPCRVLSPLLERIEKDPSLIGASTPLDLITLKGENVPELAIRAVPTVFAFKNGSVIGQFLGALPLPQLKDWYATLPK
ncbi:hypothetical protein M422DRAFT_255814 [Sphaerobolus stellatus SS14]|uniref:Thioredoxin domain-containing protein n=1 Tax=Sphaerobolus stellatus (strain SS14) TaxID=990650 RepID=A0A0C9V2S5_SPHS4|nr:hypothetical protein M422DRAFT_261996 [Sphaerobolus stellatus SS14]KIJ41304.1 hypothetical protein M422DRAFT_255814 [Sphaerobolus stellatus SS14]